MSSEILQCPDPVRDPWFARQNVRQSSKTSRIFCKRYLTGIFFDECLTHLFTTGLVQKKWSHSVTWRSKHQSQKWCLGFISLENRLVNASLFNILPANVCLFKNELSYGQGQEKWGRLHFFWTRSTTSIEFSHLIIFLGFWAVILNCQSGVYNDRPGPKT